MVNYFQIFPPLVFSYRPFFFTNRRNFQFRTWVWRKLRGCFHRSSLGWYFCYLKIQITLINEKSGVWFFINRPILSLAVEVERDFPFSSWNNAFLNEFCVCMRLSFCLCAPQGKVKGLDFGELPVRLTFSPPFTRLICVVAHLVWNASSLSNYTSQFVTYPNEETPLSLPS